jgi:hypothetical protein
MRLRHRKRQAEPKGYFRTACTVMLDTIANRTYDLRIRPVESQAKKAVETHPRFSGQAEFWTRYAYTVGLSGLCRGIAAMAKESANRFVREAGPVLISGLASAHIWLASKAIRYVASQAGKYLGRSKDDESKQADGKPSLASYIGIFGVRDIAYVATHDSVATAIAKLSQGHVKPFVAVCAVIAGTVAGLAADGLLFWAAWKRSLGSSQKTPDGGFKAFLQGVMSEFHPLCVMRGLLRTAFLRREEETARRPPASASEYAGQLWGIMESHFLWTQAMRAVAAAGIAMAGVEPAMFVTTLWAFMSKYVYVITAFISAKYQKASDKKIKESNRSLGLE